MEEQASQVENFQVDLSEEECEEIEEDEEEYEEDDIQVPMRGPIYSYSFPPLQSVNGRYFNCEATLSVLSHVYGPYFQFSGVICYCYRTYPMILDRQVLEEENLTSLQRQMAIQGSAEFSMTYFIDTDFVEKICYSGCFPLGNTVASVENLLVKLHQSRCVITDINKLHISRSIRKKARPYVITVNACYKKCVEGISKYHKNSWLYPQLRECFETLNKSDNYKVKVFSFELWNISHLDSVPKTIEELVNSCKLVAGEIGYTCGKSYTSLTGFHGENNSGTVQLVGTGVLLQLNGYKIWDFGMTMKYKTDLGAESVPRSNFLSMFKEVREQKPSKFTQTPQLVTSLLDQRKELLAQTTK